MVYHVFSAGFNDDSTAEIKELFNVIANVDSDLTLFLDSKGGYIAWAENIIKALNTKKKYIKLVGGPDLASSTLLVWLGYQGHKDVAVGVLAIAHMPIVKSDLRDGKPLACNDPKEDSVSGGKFATALIKKILTPKQMISYKQGLDVYIPYNQLRRHAIAHNKTLK